MIMYIYDDRTVENLTRGRYYKYFYERNRRLGTGNLQARASSYECKMVYSISPCLTDTEVQHKYFFLQFDEISVDTELQRQNFG
jgi:hypothetical protein